MPAPISEDILRSHGLTYKDMTLGVAMIPWLPTNHQTEMLKGAVAAVYRAALEATERFTADEETRKLFGYGKLQEECILADPGYHQHIPLGRLDLHLYEDHLKVLEFNTDGTAGWHYAAAIHGLARERIGLKPERGPLPLILLQALLRCFRTWDKEGIGNPRIAIVDWAEVATRSEQQAICDRFSERGFPTTLEDPRGLRLEGGRLVGSQGPIDLVYRRLVSEEAFARAEEIRPFLDGYLSGAACYVGSFRTDPAWSKTLLVLLSDPDFQKRIPEPDRGILASVIPWTVLLGDNPVSFMGDRWDLRDLLLSHREKFIIKPARGYEGQGLHCGALLDSVEWGERLEACFKDGAWVVQEYHEAPPFPLRREAAYKHFHVGAFVLLGHWVGLMARCTRVPVLIYPTPEIWIPAEMPPI